MTPQERFQALTPKDQAKWLDPAEVEFVAHGFGAASLNRILQTAGESKGRSYHYFDGKAGLFCATLDRALSRQAGMSLASMEQAESPQSFWATIAGLVEQITHGFQNDPNLAALFRHVHRETAARSAVEPILTRLRDGVMELVTHGQSLGAVRSDLPVSLLADTSFDLLVSIDRWFADHASDMSAEDETFVSKRSLELLIGMVSPPNSKGKEKT